MQFQLNNIFQILHFKVNFKKGQCILTKFIMSLSNLLNSFKIQLIFNLIALTQIEPH